MYKFEVGQRIFHITSRKRGSVVCIQGRDDYGVILEGNGTCVHILHASALEPLNVDTFVYGNYVESRIGTLRGTVVGFEEDTNRVICRSEKLDNYKDDRVRYAYRIDEIEIAQEDVQFEPGRRYLINCNTPVLCVPDPRSKCQVMLVREDNFKIYSSMINKTSKAKWLKDSCGIDKLCII